MKKREKRVSKRRHAMKVIREHGFVEDDLPYWKRVVYRFNESWLEWLDKFVKVAIPYLVILLLFIILGEISGWLNNLFFHGHSHFLEEVTHFMHEYHSIVLLIDQIIISAFVIDLYFNFFKSKTFGLFLKKNVIDIIAVLPMAAIFKGLGALGLLEVAQAAQIGEEVFLGQEITHVTGEAEKGAKVAIEAEKGAKLASEAEKAAKVAAESEKAAKVASEAEKAAKVAAESEKAAKATRLARTTRTVRITSRVPRLFRVLRLRDFAKKRK
jgi:hypothetical protein